MDAKEKGEALSIGLLGNVAEVLPEMLEKDVIPDVLTDQTSAHDLQLGYIPAGMSLEEAAEERELNPEMYQEAVLDSMVTHVETMLKMQEKGAITFDYGNNIRGQVADHRGMDEAFNFPGFCSCFRASVVLQRVRSVSLGRAVGQSRRYLHNG
ncbi:MAG: hypothetical protein U5J63_04590 [Fodinibius sp.]|nr:hypothetical protein [Fodinibius sp.]